MFKSCRTVSLGFTSQPVAEGSHICYIFDDEDERRQTMAKFLEAGIEEREKSLFLVDTMSTEEYVDALEEMGIDIGSQFGGVMVSQAADVYCSAGRFSIDSMLETVGQFYVRAKDEGYCGARATGEMSWALQGERTTSQQLIEYEAKVNHVVRNYPVTAICQYDARRFDIQTLKDVISTHPMAIVCGQIVKNPMYVEPQAFLQELTSRVQV